ncbi:MPK7 [Symbiodinium sp. CCMP2456]|nr:MPK7 [Symbiodinium sp. CCMP2456]
MVMEICDSDLKKLCRTDVTLTPLHINTLLYNLLVGLKYLHSAGIYHRDLKPANCLVNQDCSVKICDFGLSRAIEAAEQPHLHAPGDPSHGATGLLAVPGVPHTQRLKRNLTGHVVTRWYRAPELILLQENYTEAIDIWSVGCIYAELLGMLEGTRTQDRGPLFPGSSCFPLSPDHKHKTDYKYHTPGAQLAVLLHLGMARPYWSSGNHGRKGASAFPTQDLLENHVVCPRRGKHDQLNMIFNLLGSLAWIGRRALGFFLVGAIPGRKRKRLLLPCLQECPTWTKTKSFRCSKSWETGLELKMTFGNGFYLCCSTGPGATARHAGRARCGAARAGRRKEATELGLALNRGGVTMQEILSLGQPKLSAVKKCLVFLPG